MSTRRGGGDPLHLERPLPDGYRREWRELVSRPVESRTLGGSAALVVRLGEELVGLPPAVCEEVTEPRPTHRIPHRAGGVLLGLVRHRGRMELCVDLEGVLGIRGRDDDVGATARHVVLECEGTRFVIPVDDVVGTRRYDGGDLRDYPGGSERERAPACVRGVLARDEERVCILDEEALFRVLDERVRGEAA